ncbi:MAG TPA: hypothetical protein VGJ37_12930 [Pyrinomonadaceae bacterium]|jgi:hypothetical protein
MAAQDRRLEETESRRTLIIVVAVAAAVVIAFVFYLLMRAGGSGGPAEPRLEGAIRAGSPQFEPYKSQVVLDDPEAFESPRGLGDIVMTLKTTVRNLSGKTLNGLEIRAAVVDHQGKSVKERNVVVIPTRQPELAPNKTMEVSIWLEGFNETDDRANIKMEISAIKFKE